MAVFLEALRRLGVMEAAAKLASVDRTTVWRWRETDPEFAAAYDEALEDATDLLEAEARRRAVEGTERPVYWRGEVVGHVCQYSDVLLHALLRANRAKYRSGTSVDVRIDGRVSLASLSVDELRAELRALVAGS